MGLTDEQAHNPYGVEGRCANHFELAYTEHEFLLDFGQAYDPAAKALLHTRVIMTPHSAQAFSRMLQDLLARYNESTLTKPGRSA